MEWQEIQNLRESNQIDEAHSLAAEWIDRANESGNANNLLWAKRAMSWVLYDKLKHSVNKLASDCTDRHIEDVFSIIKEIQDLELDASEDLFFEQFAWQICAIAEQFQTKRQQQVYLFKNLFNAIKFASIPTDKDCYHLLLFRFHRGLKADEHYIRFIDWWDVKHLRHEDFQKRQNEQGRRFPSKAEQVFNAYLKQIVKALEGGRIAQEKAVEAIDTFEPIAEKYSDFNYVQYRVAQLMQMTGDAISAADRFIPFARKNSKQPWVWELFGDLNKHNPSMQISCYCRALLIKTKEDFLTNIRRKLAECLIHQQKWDEARTEVDLYITHRNNRSWKIPQVVHDWSDSNWYRSASSKENNLDFYHQHKDKSISLLYGDLPSEVVIIDYVNKKDKVVFYIKNRNDTGSFKYNNLLINPSEGDVLRVKMAPGKGKRRDLITAEHTTEKPEENLLKPFKGTFKKIGSFGFVINGERIFVKPETIKKYSLKDNTEVSGTAIASFDKKYNKWGWRVLKVNK